MVHNVYHIFLSLYISDFLNLVLKIAQIVPVY